MNQSSYSGAALALIQHAGEAGITSQELREQIGVGRETLNTLLWRLRQENSIECLRALRITINIAAGLDKTAAETRLLELVRLEKDRQKGVAAQAQKRYVERLRKEKGSKELSERQLEQRRIAAEKARLAKQLKNAQSTSKPPRVTKALQKAATSAINRLAKRIKADAAKIKKEPVKPAKEQTVTWNVQVQKIPHQPGRYEVLTTESTFGRIGQYTEAANSCAARALG